MNVEMIMRTTLAVAALALAAACGPGDPMLYSITVSPSTVAAGDDLTVTVDLENFELKNPDDAGHGHGLRAADESYEHGESDGDYPSEGHFHVYLDTVEENPLMVNCPDHCKHAGFAEEVRVRIPDTTAAGMHTLIVRLNDNSHQTLTPHIKAEANFTVQ